jgi:hypothetical protein
MSATITFNETEQFDKVNSLVTRFIRYYSKLKNDTGLLSNHLFNNNRYIAWKSVQALVKNTRSLDVIHELIAKEVDTYTKLVEESRDAKEKESNEGRLYGYEQALLMMNHLDELDSSNRFVLQSEYLQP